MSCWNQTVTVRYLQQSINLNRALNPNVQ